jgi:transposase
MPARHDRQHGDPGAPLRGWRKKRAQQAVGLDRSRGEFTTKLHTRCDAQGRPLAFVLTLGQAHDVQGPLMRMITDRIDALLADKSCDANPIRQELTDAEIESVIPAKCNRRNPAPHDRVKYRWRNRIECLFKLKNWRRVATRYDKTADSYIGFVSLPQHCCGCPLSARPSSQLVFHRASS